MGSSNRPYWRLPMFANQEGLGTFYSWIMCQRESNLHCNLSAEYRDRHGYFNVHTRFLRDIQYQACSFLIANTLIVYRYRSYGSLTRASRNDSCYLWSSCLGACMFYEAISCSLLTSLSVVFTSIYRFTTLFAFTEEDTSCKILPLTLIQFTNASRDCGPSLPLESH
jgi:hypothetical protein